MSIKELQTLTEALTLVHLVIVETAPRLSELEDIAEFRKTAAKHIRFAASYLSEAEIDLQSVGYQIEAALKNLEAAKPELEAKEAEKAEKELTRKAKKARGGVKA